MHILTTTLRAYSHVHMSRNRDAHTELLSMMLTLSMLTLATETLRG